jgi:beta-glucosidase
MAGKEVVQLYVRDIESTLPRPSKELKGYAKVALQPGEETTVQFELDKRSFAYYDAKHQDWIVETGEFEILIGSSSRNIELRDTVVVESSTVLLQTITRHSTFADLLQHPRGAAIMEAMGQHDVKDNGLGEGMDELILNTSLHNASMMSNGLFTEETLQSILAAVNS